MPRTTNIDDRKRGAFVGLAVGDALGAAVEFKAPGEFTPVIGYRAGGPHAIPAGAWTDDTSMALALADSIASVGWDLNDQARRYVRWWRHGEYSVTGRCFDIGTTTLAALDRFERLADATRSGDPDERASGNGSIMRLAPVPVRFAVYFPGNVAELCRLAAESSYPTHASPPCISACQYMALVLAALIQGEPRARVLDPHWPHLADLRRFAPLHPDVDQVASGRFRTRIPPEICDSGYVARSLEAALWAFHNATDFRQAVLAAVNLGHDADTTAAVCGQFAGAFWGYSKIPTEWLEGLVMRQTVEDAANALIL